MTARATAAAGAARSPSKAGLLTRLSGFLDIAGKYKAFIALIVTIVGGVFVVLDYFATKTEVGILRCEMFIQVEVAASQAEFRDVSGRALTVQRQLIPDEVPATRRRELEFELQSLGNEQQRVRSRLDAAESRLRGSECQREADA